MPPPDRAKTSKYASALGQRAVAELFVAAAILVWWLTSRQLPPSVFPSPYSIFLEMVRLATDGEFWWNAAATASRVLCAVAISTVLGTALALLPRYFRWTGGIVDDVLVPFFNSFPAIVWAILGTVWFGLSSTAIIVVQTLIVFPFCLINVAEGRKDLAREEVEMGRSFGRSAWPIFWRIELPMLSPFIVAGARISYGVCWKISLIAELFGGRSGLGYMMQMAQDFGNPETIIAICLAIVIFVIVGDALVLQPLSRLFQPRALAASQKPPFWRRIRTI